ncbi:hypothetical protein C0995_016502 [Termitomyces sp. Mi166|nr:hypothetical protein C0995_016502 [Termitomyces sp. Mi166\
MPEESFIVTGGSSMSRSEDFAVGHALEKDQSLFFGVLDKLRNFNFGPTTATTKVTSDQNLSAFNSTGEASYSEPLPNDSDRVEPTYLASRIQSLLKTLPSPSSSVPKSQGHAKEPQRYEDGNPVPPRGITPIHDAKLFAMLQSATVMNGGRHDDDVRERRVSVWSVLENLEGEGGQHAKDADGNGGEEDGRSVGDNVGEASGIMMYSPLLPSNLSLVEVAESGIFNPEEQEEQTVDPASETVQVAGWTGMWPFSVWSTNSAVEPGAHPTSSLAPSIATSLPSSPSGRSARPYTQTKKRVWIPSTTNLSFQAVWWGYRIYLPAPVMDTLGDKSMEYAKRTATITTALTWFFHNLPLTALPPAVRPAVLLLQTLIPYIGYLGSFISWSWGTIQSYDYGHGVILTATWLLPIALIPSTWEANDFPPSPASSLNQYLPAFGSFPSSSTPQPSPAAPLPTPPYTPPSKDTPRPEIPVQIPTEQPLSPAQSFVTALTSPLQSPAPAPAPLSYLPLAPTPAPLSYLPLASPASSPVYSPNTNTTNADVRLLSPIRLVSPYPSPSLPSLPHASEPLPPWIPPPPPPSPPTIPLPDIEEEVEVETPRFGMRVLGQVKARRSKDGWRKDEGQGKTRFMAIAGTLGGRKGDGSKGPATR